MSENKVDPFLEALKDILTKAKEDRPKGSVPYGTIVRSARLPETWGVVYDAATKGVDMDGTPIIHYSVSWCPPKDVTKTKRSVFGLSQPLITVEAEYDLIYILFPPKDLESKIG